MRLSFLIFKIQSMISLSEPMQMLDKMTYIKHWKHIMVGIIIFVNYIMIYNHLNGRKVVASFFLLRFET